MSSGRVEISSEDKPNLYCKKINIKKNEKNIDENCRIIYNSFQQGNRFNTVIERKILGNVITES